MVSLLACVISVCSFTTSCSTSRTLQRSGAAGQTKTTPQADAGKAPLNILIIEDNEINRFLLRQYLLAANHKVTEAVDGLEGLEAAENQHFDLIITDISMPRMNGIEATKAIRAGTGPSTKTRIIALTAHALPEEVERFRNSGTDEVFTKPINVKTLERVLSKLL